MKNYQLPPLPTPKFTETIRGVPCITVTEHEHLMRVYAQQALRPEPVLFIHPDTFAMNNAHVGARKPGHEFTGYTPLYTHPAPSVPGDVERDAERYRWLRDHDHWPAPFSSSQEPEPARGRDLDEAIDAAMPAAKEGTNGEIN